MMPDASSFNSYMEVVGNLVLAAAGWYTLVLRQREDFDGKKTMQSLQIDRRSFGIFSGTAPATGFRVGQRDIGATPGNLPVHQFGLNRVVRVLY